MKKAVYGADGDTLSSVIGKQLKKNKKTLSVAESCTGGLLGHLITETPGSSKYFLGGIISYHNKIKEEKLGVPAEVLRRHGAVSPQTAAAMAKNIREKLNSDYGLSITGISGPNGGSKTKPVGLVYIGYSNKNKTSVKKYNFYGTRSEIKSYAANQALDLFRLSF